MTFSSLKFPVCWTGFFSQFELDFYCLCSLQKSSSNWKKNPVQQTRNFKLANVKNQVQIDRGREARNQVLGWGGHISSVMEFQRWWVLKSKVFVQESTSSKKTLYFMNTMNYGLSKIAKIVLSKVIFYVKNQRNFFEFFFIDEYQLRRPLFVKNFFF